MANLVGTLVAAPILPFADTDTFPSHYAFYGKGNIHSVKTQTDRDAITNLRREVGMLCYVQNDDKFYQLLGGISNSNWKCFDDRYLSSFGGTLNGNLNILGTCTASKDITTNSDLNIKTVKLKDNLGALELRDSTDKNYIDLIVNNLIVKGKSTQIDSTVVNIADNIITLNSNSTGTPTINAGIEVKRGTLSKASFIWNEGIKYWTAGLEDHQYPIYLLDDNFNLPVSKEKTLYGGIDNGLAHIWSYNTGNKLNYGIKYINNTTEDKLLFTPSGNINQPDFSINNNGDANIRNNLSVGANININKNLNVSGNTKLNGSFEVVGSSILNDTLTVKNKTYLIKDLTVNSISTFNDNIISNKNLTVNGDSIFNNITVNDYLHVKGKTNLDDSVVLTKDLLIGTTLNVKSISTFEDRSYFYNDIKTNKNLIINSGNENGLQFWDNPNYKIYMADSTYGGKLDTNSDYNMYFQMSSGTNRGFVFKNENNPVFQIETNAVKSLNNIYIKTLSGWKRALNESDLGSGNNLNADKVDNRDVDDSQYTISNILTAKKTHDDLINEIGIRNNLTTTHKDNLTNAINDVDALTKSVRNISKIFVPGQPDFDVAKFNDSLNLVAGTGIILKTDTATKSILIDCDASGLIARGIYIEKGLTKRETFTATNGQTTFTLTSGEYEPKKNTISVYVWGMKQPDSAFVEVDSKTVKLNSGLSENDKVIIEYTVKGSYSTTIPPQGIGQDSTHRFVTDDERLYWNNKCEKIHSHVHSEITDFDTAVINIVGGTVKPTKVIKTGTANFAGNYQETIIVHGLPTEPSGISITPIEPSNGALGEFWVISETTKIHVINTGSFTGKFKWMVVE